MRKGFLWAAALLLTGSPFAQAQPNSFAPAKATLPDAALQPGALGAPDISKASLLPPDATSCGDPCALRVWLTADYLLWWTKGGPTSTPLVTTGSLNDVPPGALGQPGTRVLFGDHSTNYGALSGMRFGAGIALTDTLALEGGFFLLENGAVHFKAASDANGNPVIARPFFNTQLGLEDALGTAIASPLFGPYSGSTAVISHSQLQGWELNLANKYQISDRVTFVAIGGFRTLSLNEDLAIQDNVTPLTAGVLTFQGNPVAPPSTISDFDRFRTSNNFYGGQIGGRLQWEQGPFSVSALAKLGLGVTQQIATIDGASTLTTPGAGSVAAPGGVLALPSNIGRYSHSTFSVVPEVGLNLGYAITPRIKATFGYTFMYWNNVARPGEQIDRNVNPSTMPTNQAFGNGLGGGNRPSFNFQESTYWAQGLNLGLEFKF